MKTQLRDPVREVSNQPPPLQPVHFFAVDLALQGTTALVDTTALGLDRFDAQQRSRVQVEPIALPFPASVRAPG